MCELENFLAINNLIKKFKRIILLSNLIVMDFRARASESW